MMAKPYGGQEVPPPPKNNRASVRGVCDINKNETYCTELIMGSLMFRSPRYKAKVFSQEGLLDRMTSGDNIYSFGNEP